MYLELEDPAYDEWPYPKPDRTADDRWYYPITDEGDSLIMGWLATKTTVDHVISGVLADWLDEHRDSLLDGATGPTDPDVRLDRLIDWLRRRCTEPTGV